MTVGELREILSKFDSTKKVYILTPDDSPLGGGLDIANIFEVNGSSEDFDNAVYLVENQEVNIGQFNFIFDPP